MTDLYLSHEEYFVRHGFWKWLLREGVRANPFYVFSAALLGYGVLQLNTEIDPQIGKLGGIVLSLLMLHIYEFALVGAATIVLKRRKDEGGRDLHGLTIVAAIFLGGSLLALDEFCALDSTAGTQGLMGPMLFVLALALGYGKLAWYAQLPGIVLPATFRRAAVGILAAHCFAPIVGAYRQSWGLSVAEAQGLAWVVGWLSWISVIWLVTKEPPPQKADEKISPKPIVGIPAPAAPTTFEAVASPDASTPAKPGLESPIPIEPIPSAPPPIDPLQTRWAGAWLLFITLCVSVLHLYSADWVFDRSQSHVRLLPALTMLAAVIALMRWQRRKRIGFFTGILVLTPALAVNWVWTAQPPSQAGRMEWALSVCTQFWLATTLFYLLLAWTTGRSQFLIGLLGPALTPVIMGYRSMRNAIPHFKALASIGGGFALLGAGVVLSLYRRTVLLWLERERVQPKPPETRA